MFTFTSSPPAESLPPPVFDGPSEWHEPSPFDNCEEAVLPLPLNRIKYFDATIVPTSHRNTAQTDLVRVSECPRWSAWGTAQFVFDYLFTLVTSSMSSEWFKRQYHEEYIDSVYKLYMMIESIGKMPDGSPTPSIFQSFYHLRRLFPNGLVVVHDLNVVQIGTTLLLRVFALGIAVANRAIYEQRNYNLDWEDVCGILDPYVDALEIYALNTLNGDVFDLAENRSMYLNWLGHLGYYAELHYVRSGHTYLRSTADLIAFIHAQAFSLPETHRNHILPIHSPSLQTLADMLCWETKVTPLPMKTIQFNSDSRSRVRNASGILRPTAADVLEAVEEEYTYRLLYPLCVRPSTIRRNSATARLCR
ncbi:hypothetical protein K438DRAFT_40494 [Mycena galopus ATCC 62051]|nr:hypothetical protein K438DRAFT_40494 [Mycena galopus ATCC 62051]